MTPRSRRSGPLTDWISDGSSVDEIGTWSMATLRISVVTLHIGVVLGRIVLRKFAD